MTSDVKKQIAHQIMTKTSSQQIVTALRTNEEEEDSVFKMKNIYNQRQSIRHEALRNFTSTQALLKELENRDH
jgi:hypothetical protein